jgi:hypothetical protein
MLEMTRLVGVVAIPLAAVACGGTSSSITQALPSPLPSDGGDVKCTDDPRVDTYTEDLDRMGQQHVLKFTLVASDPAPPSRGINVMKLKIAQNDGTAIGGALLAKVSMPDHGHPTTVQPVITFDAASATYTINPAYLFMPGVWRIEFDAYAGSADAGAPLDTGIYYYCVEG